MKRKINIKLPSIFNALGAKKKYCIFTVNRNINTSFGWEKINIFVRKTDSLRGQDLIEINQHPYCRGACGVHKGRDERRGKLCVLKIMRIPSQRPAPSYIIARAIRSESFPAHLDLHLDGNNVQPLFYARSVFDPKPINHELRQVSFISF